MNAAQTSMSRRLRLGSNAGLRRRYMVVDEPVRANIRVGLLLEELDKLAEATGLRYARATYADARVVTAAVDDLSVRVAPDVNQDIILRARINYVGRSSMEVGVRLEQAGKVNIHLGSCYFTMVARLRDESGERSVPLPPVEYKSAKDRERASKALERREAGRRSQTTPYPTPSEYALLHDLHEELDRKHASCLLATDLITSGWERTYPEHENVPDKIFGGYVIHRAYMYAHICAEMLADQRALLVSSNRIDFYQPVRMGDKLHFVSRVTYTGKTSLTVETAITRISRDRTMTALSNTCVFTFVNVDSELNLMPVPQVFPATYSEDARYLSGYRRHQQHLERSGKRISAKLIS